MRFIIFIFILLQVFWELLEQLTFSSMVRNEFVNAKTACAFDKISYFFFEKGGIFQPGCSGWGNYVKQIAGVAGDSSACGPEAAIVEVSAKGGKWLSEKATNVFLLRKGSSLCAHSYAHTYFGDIFNVGRQNYLRGLSCKGSFEDPLDRVLKSNCSDDKAHQQRQFRKYDPFRFFGILETSFSSILFCLSKLHFIFHF